MVRTAADPALREQLTKLGVALEVEAAAAVDPARRKRLEAVRRWYAQDWLTIDPKLRSSIIKGLNVFLRSSTCPMSPRRSVRVGRQLPPLDEVIDSGKVLCLNMPAGTNPALSRAVGVLLKQAWLQTLLRRPVEMERRPGRIFRPALFLCDGYQSFVTVGEDDPAGDEKAFALTRQSRLIPIVATQSISSLQAVLGQSEAWRALLQTLRTASSCRWPTTRQRRSPAACAARSRG